MHNLPSGVTIKFWGRGEETVEMSMKSFTVCTLILITLIQHLNSKQTVSVGTIFMGNTCNATMLHVYIAYFVHSGYVRF